MFTSSCLFDVIFNDTEINAEYAAELIDIFVRGVAA